ncbi:DMT family transporter [Ureibacillus manganicus]|uniref:Ligand-binding protein SH3 n=1 Tax=Ureibacillus manganicus DSM 26584 TaxID=1384049 RepID=A0A0A3IW63_9BACL|nr:SMR family transporter [Ureibacillus manganicus]KGR79067.1 ligand-binding protein SH3 [Ureibacillus manganicus DSM 26584]
MSKGWIFVILTSLFELFWIFGLNVVSHWSHWIIIATLVIADLQFLAKACETLPTGTVYAVFAAFGTIGTTLMDVFIFNEELNIFKILFIFILVIGVIGLNISDTKEQTTAR